MVYQFDTWQQHSTQRFQFCLDLDGNLLYSRVIQGHSVTQKVDFTLQDKV